MPEGGVFLALPSYSPAHGTQGTMFGAIEAVKSKVSFEGKLTYASHSSSDLCYCFNSLWCAALNTRPHKYFVMLHSDVRPVAKSGGNWLDKLIGLADESGLNCLSCAIAIKNASGETSTALEDDSFEGVKRYTFDDLYEKPSPLTNKHEPKLLVNTGCMAVRMDASWCEEFYFKTDSWIERIAQSFMPRSLTEDWGMSMWMRDKGLSFGVTTEIGCLHLGYQQFAWKGTA